MLPHADMHRDPSRAFSFFNSLNLFALAAVLVMTLPFSAMAQQTTSGIRGTVRGPDGAPSPGQPVTVIDTRTGSRRVFTTNNSGSFTAFGLKVGGPYTVRIAGPSFAAQTIEDVYLNLGDTFDFEVTLSSATMEEVIVTASAINTVQVALGPSASFTLEDLQGAPAINRDIKDVIRIDPRIYIDEADVENIQCLGANPRFNSMTVNGVRMNDNFGLNRSGWPTERMPFSFDAIEQVAVEMAPYNVQYGGFTACNINAVTKSGYNEFSGSAFYDYTDDSMRGDKLEGDDIPIGDFKEKRWGATFGGPIIKDKLFFFISYEEQESANLFDRCADDQSCGRPVAGLSQAQIDRISQISRDVYGYDPGDTLLSTPVDDEKYLVRLDWNINDSHRAALTYNYNDGFNVVESDGDDDEFEFSNHFYNRGAQLESWAGVLFSNWTDNFSTELRYNYIEVDPEVQSIDGGFGEVQIRTYDAAGNRSRVYLGGDDSRQSNDLLYDVESFKFSGAYTWGDHVISAGYEREELDIFNLFIQHTIGEYRFDEKCNSGNPDGCIDAFEAGRPDDFYYGNAGGTNNPDDGAASFSYTINTAYIQDEFTFNNIGLTVVAGLRYDWYESGDDPAENANFVSRTGFSNAETFDGEDLLQPRLGLTWEVNDALSLRAGIGLFSGGNPNVWLANSYQNDGQTTIQSTENDVGLGGLKNSTTDSLFTLPLGPDGNGRPIYDPPTANIDFVASGSTNTGVNGIDPDFKIPSNWKLSVGATYEFDMPAGLGEGYILNADLIITRGQDSPFIRDDTLVQVDTAPDGRPIYFPTDKSIPSCEADPNSDPGGCSRLFNNDFVLDNARQDDEQLAISFTVSKSYDWGLDWTVGYSYQESDNTAPMTSSVAFSNYILNSVIDPNNPGRRVSNYEIPHRFIFRLGYKRAFFGDYETRFSLYGSYNEGRPYSYTFSDQAMFIRGPFFNPDDTRSLFYMPSGPDDPNVRFDPGFDTDAFFAYARQDGLDKYGGQIVPKNKFNSDWWTKVDIKITQEFPGFNSEHRGSAYIVIENFLNFLNDDWGVLKEQGFPRQRDIVEASLDTDTNQYVFEEFFPRQQGRATDASLWELRVGVNYNF